jgi:hypothetical protein
MRNTLESSSISVREALFPVQMPESTYVGHVVVPKAWIGKEAIVTLKENRTKGKK